MWDTILRLFGRRRAPAIPKAVARETWQQVPGNGQDNRHSQYKGQSIGSLLEVVTRERVGKVLDRPLTPGSETGGTERFAIRRRSAPRRQSNREEYPLVIDIMHVTKRSGNKEPVSLDKVTSRIRKLVEDPFETYYQATSWIRPDRICIDTDKHVTGEKLADADPVRVSQKVCSGLYDGVTTRELDELSAETAMAMATTHPDYGVLASRIAVSNLHKETPGSIRDSFLALGRDRLDPEIYDAITTDEDLFRRVETAMDYTKDYACDYFSIKTLMRVYLLTDDGGRIAERPQHMFMRVALGIHGIHDVNDALETYRLMSERYFTHATPTLFNSGTRVPQNASCYLYGITEETDSIVGIYDTLKKCAMISKYGGGIGLHVHDVRAQGSKIKGTNGTSTGVVPMLKVFNDTARYVNQSGKRKGSIAVYMEPWHADIMDFLDLKRNNGLDEDRARDLFYAMWIPDIFMRRVQDNKEWTLFCPSRARALPGAYGEAFDAIYEELEKEPGAASKRVSARSVWNAMMTSQVETGVPYILFKDACNAKSNQKNLGTIRSSNLCTEIIQYSDSDECSVCNLASICLPKFVAVSRSGDTYVDYEGIHAVVKTAVKNLNKVIDRSFYPIPEAKRSNMRHRPIGIGVQGLADVFFMMRAPFESGMARDINRQIFETIYHAAVEASCALAREHGSYETFEGSPASEGLLQFDLWNAPQNAERYDWEQLKREVVFHGLRNSLLLAPMPTASTAQIMGNTEGFEPVQSNMFVRKTLAGEFLVINKYLTADLQRLGMWSDGVKDLVIQNKGSIQAIPGIPDDIKALYKTAYEIKQRSIIDLAADRGVYICQSQSLNLFLARPRYDVMSSMLFYAWERGLKTGQYYLRSLPAADPIAVTVVRRQSDPGSSTEDSCIMCSS